MMGNYALLLFMTLLINSLPQPEWSALEERGPVLSTAAFSGR